ncbi:MAG: abortive infection family protein [Alphaproteobacteria bacterium]|jgi:hypothetical protein|uniref:abortive infection family protein n=1 Tax=Rhizorhabdus sp. TaxID=1968843 RepID=UPI001ACD2F11|nr:abortive infection family protein [Rhizorhabdus sp.]MBN9529894.1 abortive infection family protein [Alphaproteobacteria bacterium]MBP8231562.1 abortive infection family protein [Rhizorhabdus sp.]
MKSQIRHLVAEALYPTKSYELPAACERYGLAPGNDQEAFASKKTYVLSRLKNLSDEQVLVIAERVLADHRSDKLQAAVAQLRNEGGLVTDLTRLHLMKALEPFSLSGDLELVEMMRSHWPGIERPIDFGESLAEKIWRHAVDHDDWSNRDTLDAVGFRNCSQATIFAFLADVVDPKRRNQNEQDAIIQALNPILERDGFHLVVTRQVSGYPSYGVQSMPTGTPPADPDISKALKSFDEGGVHAAWEKALARRRNDPDGAITAAKSLLESVCKHIIEEGGGTYGSRDDLPKLYAKAAESLRLAPNQHSEAVFKTILGGCQAVVGGLAAVRNQLGDSHGQGKKPVRPLARHAELAVNLAGSISMFLVSTWSARTAGKN